MSQTPSTVEPQFTEEYGLFYLWNPEPQASKIQLAGEFKTEEQLQQRSLQVFGSRAVRRLAA